MSAPIDRTVALMLDSGWWRSRVPELTISENLGGDRVRVDSPHGEHFLAALRSQGWAQQDDVADVVLLDRLRKGVLTLREYRLPAPFLFVFDEAWALFTGLDPLWRSVLGNGYRALPCFWCWFVAPGPKNRGWPVHRDRMNGPRNVLDDGTPLTLSAWIPLTPATPANGCMYLVPAPDGQEHWENIALNSVRAVPAEPGSVLAWRQDIWHWSGHSSGIAEVPRISIGLEFQADTDTAFDRPLIDLAEPLTLRQRLALVGMNIWRYRKWVSNKRTHELARSLIRVAPELVRK